MEEIAQVLSLPTTTIVSAVCHLLWHQIIDADLRHTLLFVDAAPVAHFQVWLRGEAPLI